MAMANGIPPEAALLSTHMFLMYYSILADVTPPVALSAYASASVFLTNPLKTGWYAAKVALPKYLLGFSFILAYQGTALLLIPMWRTASGFEAITDFIIRLGIVSAGAICMAAATVGYTRRSLRPMGILGPGIFSIGMFLPFLWVNIAVLLVSFWFFLGRKSELSALSKIENNFLKALQ